MNEKFTTGNKDIDWLIFDELSDKDIINLCRVNKEMSKLCDDEQFWEYRVKKRYPTYHKTKRKYNGFKSFYSQTRGIPHYFNRISLDEWNIKQISLDIILPKKAFIFADNFEKVNTGDLVDIEFKKSDLEYDATYIVTKIKGDQITITRMDSEYDEKIKEWTIPKTAEKIFLKFGFNAYKHIFERDIEFHNIDQLKIKVGKYTFKYPSLNK